MPVSIEIAALLALLLLLGGGYSVGAFDPILGAIGEGWSILKRRLNSDRGAAPISINNRNVEQSDTNVEVHFHYHSSDGEDKQPISEVRPPRRDSD